MTWLSVTEARARLPEVVNRVAEGEEIILTRHGEPVAVILRPDAVRVRRAEQTIERARHVAARLSDAREQPLPPAAESPATRADELVEAARATRDRS
jgi:prevent-host-death family protein